MLSKIVASREPLLTPTNDAGVGAFVGVCALMSLQVLEPTEPFVAALGVADVLLGDGRLSHTTGHRREGKNDTGARRLSGLGRRRHEIGGFKDLSTTVDGGDASFAKARRLLGRRGRIRRVRCVGVGEPPDEGRERAHRGSKVILRGAGSGHAIDHERAEGLLRVGKGLVAVFGGEHDGGIKGRHRVDKLEVKAVDGDRQGVVGRRESHKRRSEGLFAVAAAFFLGVHIIEIEA